MALARAKGAARRFYSLSAQIQRERKQYDEQLEATQSGTLDVTPWLNWLLACLLRTVQHADSLLAGVLGKAQSWQRWVLNHILDQTPGDPAAQPKPAALTNKKWAFLAKCSADTTLRGITDLLERGMLRKMEGRGGARGIWWSNREKPSSSAGKLQTSPF